MSEHVRHESEALGGRTEREVERPELMEEKTMMRITPSTIRSVPWMSLRVTAVGLCRHSGVSIHSSPPNSTVAKTHASRPVPGYRSRLESALIPTETQQDRGRSQTHQPPRKQEVEHQRARPQRRHELGTQVLKRERRPDELGQDVGRDPCEPNRAEVLGSFVGGVGKGLDL